VADGLPKNVRAIAFLALWVTVFVVNVPVEWGGDGNVIALRKLFFPLHAALGLGGSYGMRMFARPDRRGNMCMIALGFHDDGTVSELLFEPPIRDCLNPGVRLLQNNGHHAFFKYFAMLVRPGTPYRVYRKGKSPEHFQADLGEAFCARARSEGHPIDRMFVGMFREMYYPDYPLVQRGAPPKTRRELVPGFGFDCNRHALVSITGPMVFTTLKKDHPRLYAIFEGYQGERPLSGRRDDPSTPNPVHTSALAGSAGPTGARSPGGRDRTVRAQ
jgi:hypothetical protein